MPCVPRNVPSPYCSETWPHRPPILDQLERRAEGQNLGPLDLFDLGEPPRVAGIAQAIAEGVRRGLGDSTVSAPSSARRLSTSAWRA